MVDNNLYESLLPTAMFIKGIVRGKKENYENYLREFINNSLFFYKKAQGHIYEAPQKEDEGECDCTTGNYGLDFKIFGSKSMCYAKGSLSAQIVVHDSGMIITCQSEKSGSMTSSILHKLLRVYDFDSNELNIPLDQNTELYLEDIKAFRKTLLKGKNILFFYPYNLYFKNDYNFNYALSEIEKALEKDLLNAFNYRNKICAKYDTFFSFIYNDFFIILQYEDGKLKIRDYINTEKSETYSRMMFDYVL